MKLNSPRNSTHDIPMHKSIDTHGTSNDLGFTPTRNLYYKEQVTNVPAEYYYHVGDVSFDGYRDVIIVDTKGEGLLKFIETNWTASVYENGGLVDWALRRLEAVRNVGATLHPLAHRREETFDELWKRQMDNEFPTEIELIHTPPN